MLKFLESHYTVFPKRSMDLFVFGIMIDMDPEFYIVPFPPRLYDLKVKIMYLEFSCKVLR